MIQPRASRLTTSVRTAVVAVCAVASGFAVTADAKAVGTSCENTPTAGMEVRTPYLPDAAATAVAGAYAERQQPADVQHAYLVYVPATAPAGPLPVVVTMHGLLGSAKQHVAQTNWQHTADTHGFILVAPNGHRSWDYTHGSVDTDYLRDVVADVRAKNCVDDRRIYVSGHSMGGFMTHRVTCDLGHIFAAGASYAAGDLSNGGACTPGFDADGNPVPGWERMPIANWHGTDDGVIAYAGGRRGIDKWVARYDCDSTPAVTDDEYGSSERWTNCLDGVEVQLRTYDGHGHAWPDGCGGQNSGTGGSVACEPEPGTGPWPAATDLTEEIWTFVSQYQRSEPAAPLPPPSPDAPTGRDASIATEAVAGGVETGIDSAATFHRTSGLTVSGRALSVSFVFRVAYDGDGAGIGASHPVCPTSNPGPGTQSMPNRVVTVSAVDRSGQTVSVDVVTEPVVVENSDGTTDHVELVHAELPGRFHPNRTVLRAHHAGDALKFWWACGTPPARYKETIGTTKVEPWPSN